MKKIVIMFVLMLGVPLQMFGAEAAAAELPGMEKKEVIHNSVFLSADMAYGSAPKTIFDSLAWEENQYMRKKPENRVTIPNIGTADMAGIQHGESYYTFVPDSKSSRVLVFRLREDGTIEANIDGEKFSSIPTSASVTSVTAVKDTNNTLFVGVTTVAPSLEVFRLVGDMWNQVTRVPLTSESSASASASAAVETSQSNSIINGILHKGLIYFCMVDNNNSHVQVVTMDSSGTITTQDYPELLLPFNIEDTGKNKNYKIATVEHNNKLYVFVVGEIDKSSGFIYGWKLEENGRFVPVIEEQNDSLPNDIVVHDTEQGLYLSVTFFNKFRIDVYKLADNFFEGPIGQGESRIRDLPIKIRKMPFRDNRDIMVLVNKRRAYYLQTYSIGDTGAQQVSSSLIDPTKVPILYRDFVIVPALTKEQVVRRLDEATESKYPADIVELISKFVVEQ